MQEISGNSVQGGERVPRQLEPKTKDWFILFHEGDKRDSKGREDLSILQPEVTLSSNLFLGPSGVHSKIPSL